MSFVMFSAYWGGNPFGFSLDVHDARQELASYAVKRPGRF
jgi:hypothetical protein